MCAGVDNTPDSLVVGRAVSIYFHHRTDSSVIGLTREGKHDHHVILHEEMVNATSWLFSVKVVSRWFPVQCMYDNARDLFTAVEQGVL